MAVSNTLTATWGLLLCLAIYKWIIQPALLSPLAKLPNAHWSAPFSRLWIFYERVLQRDTLAVHEAHGQLGAMVRLAPNEVSVNYLEAVRTIYGGSYEKNDWYHNIFSNYGIRSMFTMRGNMEHGERKKALGNVYTKSSLLSSTDVQAITRTLVNERLLPHLTWLANSGGAVEHYDTSFAWSMDFVTAFLFGLKSGSDLLSDPAQARKSVVSYKARGKFLSLPQEMPTLTGWMGKYGLLARIVPQHAVDWDTEAYILQMQDAAEDMVRATGKSAQQRQPGDWPTVYAQLRGSLLASDDRLKDNAQRDLIAPSLRLEIASEMADHIVAGFDTSGTTLSFVAWELSKVENVAWQDKLRNEVSQIADIGELKKLDKLVVLDAIINETMRLYPPVGGNQVRVTPSHKPALFDAPGCGSVQLPANIRIHAQAWSLHRNASVFPEPECWKPERWLTATEDQLKEMHRWFWPFGSGLRMCIGNNLAMLELKAMAASMWKGFRTEVVDGRGMIQNTGFIGGPLGVDGSYLRLRLYAVNNAH